MQSPAISVIVVTSDRAIDLRRCLGELQRHLAGTGVPPTEVLTIHAPHDRLAIDMVRHEFPWVAAHIATQRHLSRQRNEGARLARGQVLVYLDDDAWPRPDWLRELAAAFNDPAVLVASGPVFRGDGSTQCRRLAASRIGRLIPLADDAPLPSGMAPSFSGCNLAVRRTALFACGGFDENLPYQPDDMDLCARVFELSGRAAEAFAFQPGAAVVHESSPGPFRRTLQDRAWYVVARDNIYFACRHAGPVRGLLGGCVLQLPKLPRFVYWLATGKLGPLACLRCLGKHTAGMLAGVIKGLREPGRLPLRPLPPPTAAPTSEPEPMRENAPCRRPQPI
jgi:GT2 family glycosyltransferase